MVTVTALLLVVAMGIGILVAARWLVGGSESRAVGLLGIAIALIGLVLLWDRLP